MAKNTFLNEITTRARSGGLSRQEVVDAYEAGSGYRHERERVANVHTDHNTMITRILSYVGSGIVFLGIVILVAQFWEEIPVVGRVLITFGTGVVAYVVAVLCGMYDRLDYASRAFYLIAALCVPVGLVVIAEEFTSLGVYDMNLIISLMSALLFACTFFLVQKKTLILVVVIGFGTWFFFALTASILDMAGTFIVDEWKVFAYLTLVIGACYALFGYSFREREWSVLTPWLYSFGVLGILTSTVFLGGVWDVLFIGVVFGVLFLSIYLSSRSFLIFGALFLMIYIGKLTVQYFIDVVYWPVALVVAGLALIGVGYMTYSLYERFASHEDNTL